MATTVMQILEMAYAKSTQNNPGTIATESVELLGVVQRVLDGCYAVAARVNPIMFAEQAIVAPGNSRVDLSDREGGRHHGRGCAL